MSDPIRPGIVRALVGPDASRDFSGLSWRERGHLRRAGVKVPPSVQAFADSFTDHGRAGCCATERTDGAQPPAAGEAAGGTNFKEAQ